MPSLGPWELAVILILVIVIFGAGKLPEVGSALGKGIREFRQAKGSLDDLGKEIKDIKSEVDITAEAKTERKG